MSLEATNLSPAAAGPAVPTKPIAVKLVLLGEAAVGKSSLVQRFVHNEFQENKEPTIGAAFQTQKIEVEGKTIKFEIWDTAGQERFHSLAPMYYRNAQAAIVVYDITRSSSIDKAKSWVKELQRQANPNIVIALTGNKLDLVQGLDSDDEDDLNGRRFDGSDDRDDDTVIESGGDDDEEEEEAPIRREVSTEEARSYADEAGLLFFETSAKLDQCVIEVFNEIARRIPIDSNITPSRGSRAGTSGTHHIDLITENNQGINGTISASCSC